VRQNDSWQSKPSYKVLLVLAAGIVVAICFNRHVFGIDPDGVIFPRILIVCVFVACWFVAHVLIDLRHT
jgi:cation transporter-like permease